MSGQILFSGGSGPWQNEMSALTLVSVPAPRTRKAMRYPTVAAELLRVREENAWSQEDAAHEAGVVTTTWGRWERGERRPRKEHLPGLSRIGVDVAQFRASQADQGVVDDTLREALGEIRTGMAALAHAFDLLLSDRADDSAERLEVRRELAELRERAAAAQMAGAFAEAADRAARDT